LVDWLTPKQLKSLIKNIKVIVIVDEQTSQGKIEVVLVANRYVIKSLDNRNHAAGIYV
jgi:hypothetical protein